jgi:aquaporin Z
VRVYIFIEVVMFRKLAAECFGTFWLVFGGCGSAVLAAAFPELGIGFAGVALAFGLTVLTMAFAVGHISGGHFNPAVTLGLWAGGRFPAKDVIGYIIAQVVGGIIAAAFCTWLPAVKPALMPPPAALPPTAMANTLRAASPCCPPS